MTNPKAGAPAPRRVIAPRNWKDQFLARLAETSNVTASAEAASISLSCVYRNRREDREFGRAWQAALAEGYDNLEMDPLYRLRTGEAKDADGRKFDNATAFRVLCAHREEVARERARRDDEDEATILAELDAKLARMREREREIAAEIAAEMAAATAAGGGTYGD